MYHYELMNSLPYEIRPTFHVRKYILHRIFQVIDQIW